PFVLEGESGFLHVLKERLQRRKHAVIVVAEGAGQDLMKSEKEERDASGNIRLVDIGLFLKERIQQYFDALHMEINTKYIDPSYIIRSVKPTAQDSVYCLRLAEYAVHAAMSGKTKMVVAKRHDKYIHLPMSLLGTGRKQIDPEGSLWYSVIEATGQPVHFI
ncbi:MAG: ATP-dependent 6-phosphofructokinase, partial [Chlamydiota bacterium]|nr:ATP-dependent 6-phosphofructokinase [Chlamydiota bacterium]